MRWFLMMCNIIPSKPFFFFETAIPLLFPHINVCPFLSFSSNYVLFIIKKKKKAWVVIKVAVVVEDTPTRTTTTTTMTVLDHKTVVVPSSTNLVFLPEHPSSYVVKSTPEKIIPSNYIWLLNH